MKYLIALIFLFYSRLLAAQTAYSFIGKWHVEHTLSPMNIPPKLQKQLNKLRALYEGATFEFYPDAKFTLRSKDAKSGIGNGY
jgi:hypothetical protein